jgi:type II secretory ATPase GspE/PulE/Tfp pilus assembly ATPase PilB-like protein
LIKRGIGDLLLDNGQITPEELKLAQIEHEKTGDSISKILQKLGLANDNHIKNALELEYGVNYLDLKKLEPDPSILALLPETLIRQYEAIPVNKQGARLTLAMVTPSDDLAVKELKHILADWQLKPVVCCEDDFIDFVGRSFLLQPVNEDEKTTIEINGEDNAPEMLNSGAIGQESNNSVPSILPTLAAAKSSLEAIKATGPEENSYLKSIGQTEKTSLESIAEVAKERKSSLEAAASVADAEKNSFEEAADAAVLLLSQHIVSNAVNKGCSNIHIEPTEKEVLVHYRKEGVLLPARKLPLALLPDLLKTYKSMTATNDTEDRLPLDGHLKVELEGKPPALFRLSIVPGAHGEHLVLWLD